MPEKINDHTTAEIAEAIAKFQLKSRRIERECAWCNKLVSMRNDQHFCRPACRAAYANAAARIEHERLLAERDQWRKEREDFVREIARLRAMLP